MDDIKRVTRSKATAKTKSAEPELKIATAAAQAKSTRNTVSTMTKRKTRTDGVIEERNDTDEVPLEEGLGKPKATRGRKKATQAEPRVEMISDEEISVPTPLYAKPTRGRPKKVVEEALPTEPPKLTRGRAKKEDIAEFPVEEAPPAEPMKSTRGRQKKVEAAGDTLMEEAVKLARGRSRKVEIRGGPPIEDVPPAEPTKPTRGRLKKVVATNTPAEIIPDLAKRTRGRPTTMSKVTTIPKKSVKFEGPHEQDKENITLETIARGKGEGCEAGTGLKAKPLRKPAVNTRAVRGRCKTTSGEGKLPLTPKKATQVATAKENVSEDELSTREKTPMKLLSKSPAKTPGSVFSTAKKLDFTTSIITNRAVTQDVGSSLMGSPARRPPSSPYKDFLKTSPKRANLGDPLLKSPFKSFMQYPKSTDSAIKTSFLQSPARRPQSPTKVSNSGSQVKCRPAMGATPKFTVSRFGVSPRTLSKNVNPPGRSLHNSPSKGPSEETASIDSHLNATTTKPFPGRLSCILSREADLIMQGLTVGKETSQVAKPNNAIIPGEDESSIDPINGDATVMDSALQDIDMILEKPQSTTPTSSPPRHSAGILSLQDEDPFQSSDSEDELASGSPKYSPAPLNTLNISSKDSTSPATPAPVLAVHKTPKTIGVYRSTTQAQLNVARSQSVKSQKYQVGFTPIFHQANDSMFAMVQNSSALPSPSDNQNKESPTALGFDLDSPGIGTVFQPYPGRSTFFEDAMTIEEPTQKLGFDHPPCVLSADSTDLDTLSFAPITVDEEDLSLAAEADEMSLIAVDKDDVAESIGIPNQSINGDVRAVSEASQEYGDENTAPIDSNTVPIDPALLAFDAQHQETYSVAINTRAIFTPAKALGERECVFHTISKVPIKPAAEESPLKLNKQSASVSRMQAKRYAPLPPSFAIPKLPVLNRPVVISPNRSKSWSTAVTPIRTPRKDLNDQILKGAVVFVDVHTTEGADASAVFVELLGQMGARCVKGWSWNPSSSNSPEPDDASKERKDKALDGGSNKIGITHVVFKDGGKRTLEKVRESSGVVLCVGVGWVLDCERQQTWLPESNYAIDIALIPRGGHRRRKSMEPRSIQNLNGAISLLPSCNGTPRSVSASHAISPTKEFLDLPDTPATNARTARRRSTLWVRSPSSDGDANEDAAGLMLSPVPATPAPETISAYAEHILDNSSPDGGATPYFLHREELMQRTCPPKHGLGDASNGLGIEEEVEGIANGGGLMQRLLQARRKSLQWAPKVGSPLAKGGFGVDSSAL